MDAQEGKKAGIDFNRVLIMKSAGSVYAMGNKNIALHITFFTYCSCSGSRIAYTRRLSVAVVYRNGRTRSTAMRVAHCLRLAESKGLVHGGSVAPPHILLPQRLSQQRWEDL